MTWAGKNQAKTETNPIESSTGAPDLGHEISWDPLDVRYFKDEYQEFEILQHFTGMKVYLWS